MNTLPEIEQAVRQLSSEELAAFTPKIGIANLKQTWQQVVLMLWQKKH
jgi:hypothetical protein